MLTVAKGRGLRERDPAVRPPVLGCPSKHTLPDPANLSPSLGWVPAWVAAGGCHPGARGRGGHTASSPAWGEPWGGACREAGCLGELTFSLDTWWEKGHVPSVFLHVPRRNLCKGGKRVRGAGEARGRAPAWPPAPPPPPGPVGRRAPGAHGHLVGVVDVGAVLAVVAPAEPVVVHAVFLLLLPPPLPCLPDDGQAALDGPAVDGGGAL